MTAGVRALGLRRPRPSNALGEPETGVGRARSGRFAELPRCDACGKPVSEHFTEDRVCGGSDGPGFYVCGRKRCAARLEKAEAEGGLDALREVLFAGRAALHGTRFSRERHAAHYDHDHPAKGHDLFWWDFAAPTRPRVAPGAPYPGVPHGAEYHSGYLENGVQRWRFVALAPFSQDHTCVRCRPIREA